jgi:tetratricopeptide (TPR) repeat protein
MAPEQARGEVEAVDERADVFALGSILAEVLTGSPAFTGRSSGEILRNAARADTAGALARLDAGEADAELVALARDCLAAEPAGRPRDAGAVSGRVTAYLAGVQERLRAAEIDRARAEARAAEERRRRRLQLGLAASLLALVGLGGLATAYEVNRRQALAARSDRLLAEAVLLRDQARAQPEDVGRWRRAREAVVRVAEDVGPSGSAELRREVEAGLEAAEANGKLLERLVDIRGAQADDQDGSATDAAYADAFGGAGIEPDRGDPAGAGSRVARRPGPVAAALVAALDHWAALRRVRDPKGPGWARVLAAARAADRDPDRDALRAALSIEDRAGRLERLRPLAGRADAGSWAPASLVLLGEALAEAGDVDAGAAVLRRVSWAHPEDARAHFALGLLLAEARPPQPEEAIRALSVAWGRQPELAAFELARALEGRGRGAEAEAVWRDLVGRRPDNGLSLGAYGMYLKARGRGVEAAAVLGRAAEALREAIRLKPDFAQAHTNLGAVLREAGDLPGAVAAHREAIRLKPGYSKAHSNLGAALYESGDPAGGVAAFREAIRLKPDLAEVHFNLGAALYESGDLPGAVASYREAIRLRPDLAKAHSNLGTALGSSGDLPGAGVAFREAIRLKPDLAEAHTGLGKVLHETGDLPGAVAAFREAIRLKPDLALAHSNLGVVLSETGDLLGAIAACREAIRLKPDYADAHSNLGHALGGSGDLPGAIASYREAIRLKPDHAHAHCSLGKVLHETGDLPGAIASYREAIRLETGYAEAHCNLGLALQQQGQYAESLAELRLGHELGSKRAGWRNPSARWLAEAERLAALADRLPAVLKGTDKPADNAERLAFALMAYDAKRHAAAARLWGEALAADPKLVDDRQAGHAYNAACAAALAAAGRGEDDPKPDDAARAGLRRRALGWLRGELAAWSKALDGDAPKARAAVAQTLLHWRRDPDLAGIRDAGALAALPEAEREECQALWAEADRLLRRAGRAR